MADTLVELKKCSEALMMKPEESREEESTSCVKIVKFLETLQTTILQREGAQFQKVRYKAGKKFHFPGIYIATFLIISYVFLYLRRQHFPPSANIC